MQHDTHLELSRYQIVFVQHAVKLGQCSDGSYILHILEAGAIIVQHKGTGYRTAVSGKE